MGISFFSSCCIESSCQKIRDLSPNNPNPKKFKIEKIKSIGRFVIAKIRYPDCINYEGNKILVFENTSKREVLSAKEIDPHFCESNHLYLIARFEPTKKGWQNAIVFCKNA